MEEVMSPSSAMCSENKLSGVYFILLICNFLLRIILWEMASIAQFNFYFEVSWSLRENASSKDTRLCYWALKVCTYTK